MRNACIIAVGILCSLSLFAESYKVEFEGLGDTTVKKAFKDSSQAIALQAKGTTKLATLKRRAQNDKEKFEDLAHYYGYYSAKISYKIVGSGNVVFQCDLGPRYKLESCTIETTQNPELLPKLSLRKNQLITTQQIVDAEKSILWHLKKQGYAKAAILRRECTANVSTYTLAVTFFVDPGPLMSFGKSQVVGNQNVKREAIDKYIACNEGSTYSPIDIDKTQKQLEKTGLFSSVIITEDGDGLDSPLLPLTINVQESKHHSIGAGVAYATSFGPGIKATWENINLRGLGDKLTFRTELWQKYQMVLLSLTKPHFREQDQDLIWVAEYDKLRNIAFDARSYNISGILQKRMSHNAEMQMGLRGEWLHSHNFEGSHFYHLIKMPLQFKWSDANNLLDPTKGESVNVKVTPTTNFLEPRFFYTMQTTALTGYHSVVNNHLTLAARVVFANILGAARHTIPPPDRIYGGSENVLRGYKAYTISPLHHKRIPIGGRSMLAGSLEARFRTKGDFGYVLFYDVGNVYKKNVPELRIRQMQSVGIGLRYTTPIGPLRFDVAVPLNRRRDIDPSFQIYFSIGQSF